MLDDNAGNKWEAFKNFAVFDGMKLKKRVRATRAT